jgi:hypothetical protein
MHSTEQRSEWHIDKRLYVCCSAHEYVRVGFAGAQVYDPINTPHSIGNLKLGLPFGGPAVIIDHQAYFAGSGE